jgi:phage terminase large subunit-like protein
MAGRKRQAPRTGGDSRAPLAWQTSCRDWEGRIKEGRSIIPCAPLFPEEAASALEMFKALRIVEAPGRPTFGEAAGQWVFDLVAAIFGAYDSNSGSRLISEFFVLIAKKNGKSLIAAGIMLTALIRNWRESAELIILAPTIKAANNSFRPAADMVRADPELNSAEGGALHVIDHERKIKHLKTGATLQILAADTGTVVGVKAGFVLIDELWEFGPRAKADAMFREALGGLVTRPEGFVISITTQSDAAPAGVFKDKLEYARKVRDGEVEDRKFMPVLYEFPKSMIASGAYLDLDNAYMVNPHLAATAWGREWLEHEMGKEIEKGPETRNVFLAKHLNIEIGLALGSDRWAGADHWDRRADRSLNLREIIRRCVAIVVGLDGGGLDDLLGMAVLGRDAEGRRYLWNRAWAHVGVLDRRKSEASRMRDFERDGDLSIVAAMEEGFAEMGELVDQVKASGKLCGVAVDPYGVKAINQAMDDIGIPEVVGIPQGWKLSGAIKDVEIKLADGSMTHAGQPLMAWCVGNAKAEAKGNAITITKQTAGVAKIDPLVATFIAEALMAMNPQPARAPQFQMIVI